jgi:hypothetical protein
MMRNKLLLVVSLKKVTESLGGILTKSLSGEKLALSLAFGVTCGTFPMFAVTTILCTLAALVLKLNLPAIQFANYLVYPSNGKA